MGRPVTLLERRQNNPNVSKVQTKNSSTTYTIFEYRKMQTWLTQLNRIFRQHSSYSARSRRVVGYATRIKREEEIVRGFRVLRQVGIRLDDPTSFRERHLRRLVEIWEEEGNSPATIAQRISTFRVFARWIGKPSMIGRSDSYVSSPEKVRRHTVTREDKTWSGQQIDNILEVIEAVARTDATVAMQLELQYAFGLRAQEAMMLRPHQDDHTHWLNVSRGTKGGRQRVVPIETDYQRDVLRRAREMSPNVASSTTPRRHKVCQWRHRFYRVLRRHGISRESGIVAHGLRHELANATYERITGEPTPIKGGNTRNVERDLDTMARQTVTELLGHSRTSIIGAYTGSQRTADAAITARGNDGLATQRSPCRWNGLQFAKMKEPDPPSDPDNRG